MSVAKRHLKISGLIENIRLACDFVSEVAEEAGFSDDAVFHCNLAVEEICTNIVEHGYGHDGAAKFIDISCMLDTDLLTIVIADDAESFNPLSLSDPDPNTPLWEREGGGWGIYFVKQYMNDIRYELNDGRNHLILEKRK